MSASKDKDKGFFDPDAPLRTRYFQLASTRTQPYLVTLFQAVMAFKRLAKILKFRLTKKRRKVRSGVSLLRRQMVGSQDAATESRFGHHHQYLETIKKPSTVHVVYRATSDGMFVKVSSTGDDKSTKKRDRRTKNIIETVAKHVSNQNAQHASGRYVSAGDKLGAKLQTKESDALLAKNNNNSVMFDTGALATEHVAGGSASGDSPQKPTAAVPDEIANLISKNFTLSTMKVGDPSKLTAHSKQVTEYMPGTSIYFGATIALQAKHGGYLSYNDPQTIKASAHKILQHSRLMVLNSDDLTDIGVLRYGDAVWLQAGLFDVLGANYSGGPIVAHQTRKIRPALINSRRENMFKAQQYGRWIVLNKDNPIGTIGQHVTHQDRILLEQEWYFLCSMSPYESSMYRTKADMDEMVKTGKGGSDLFNPGDECGWKIHLVKLPKEDISNEKERQRDAKIALDQLKTSETNRLDYIGKISTIFNDMVEANGDEGKLEMLLQHKLQEETNNLHLAEIHARKASNNWEKNWVSLSALSKIYGKDSIITKCKREVIKYRSINQQSSVPVQIERIKSKLVKAQEKYWDLAGGLLQDTKASNEMPNSLSKYYEVDLHRKIKAAKILQRCVRRYLSKIFDFRRSLLGTEKQIRDKVTTMVRDKRKLLIENSITENRLSGKREISSDLYKSNAISVDTLNIFDNPSLNSADVNKLNASKRATNMYNYLNEQWERSFGERSFYIHKLQEDKVEADKLMELKLLKKANAKLGKPDPSSDRSGGSSPKASSDKMNRAQSTSGLPSHKDSGVAAHKQLVGSASLSLIPPTQLEPESQDNQVADSPASFVASSTHIAHFGYSAQSSRRPQSGNVAVSSNASLSESVHKLGRTKERDFGLPADVFENTESSVNIKTGMKFLRAMSKNPEMYDDIKVVSKKRAKSAPSKRMN